MYRQGLGAATPQTAEYVLCNWTDEFGYSALDPKYYCGSGAAASSGSFSAFVNKNAMVIGIGAVAFLMVMMASKR